MLFLIVLLGKHQGLRQTVKGACTFSQLENAFYRSPLTKYVVWLGRALELKIR